ncbi:hypothetical protein METHB2_190027 [Candidatus Methylobacter favarea]|uniref:Uncharacterized protein n=1 Tax=Candidatus Methylobacter favarea TaxID=2707345 RepID=A0A8S0Y5Z7_9GAMM|nr:hypothetical protein [Candidatus Methylobacter favarea]CAA9890140.1 hypothetical protein METHB2_190027 [Candidatus Methylobacter favarea]
MVGTTLFTIVYDYCCYVHQACSLAFVLWNYNRIKRLVEDLGNEQHLACCDADWMVVGFSSAACLQYLARYKKPVTAASWIANNIVY